MRFGLVPLRFSASALKSKLWPRHQVLGKTDGLLSTVRMRMAGYSQ
jgi:hypothetical protein